MKSDPPSTQRASSPKTRGSGRKIHVLLRHQNLICPAPEEKLASKLHVGDNVGKASEKRWRKTTLSIPKIRSFGYESSCNFLWFQTFHQDSVDSISQSRNHLTLIHLEKNSNHEGERFAHQSGPSTKIVLVVTAGAMEGASPRKSLAKQACHPEPVGIEQNKDITGKRGAQPSKIDSPKSIHPIRCRAVLMKIKR